MALIKKKKKTRPLRYKGSGEAESMQTAITEEGFRNLGGQRWEKQHLRSFNPMKGSKQEQVSEWTSLYASLNPQKEQNSSKVIMYTHRWLLKKLYENIPIETSG